MPYNYEYVKQSTEERKSDGGQEREREREINSYMIEQAVLPALEDDIVSDVSVNERREPILVGRGGDLDGIGND